MNKIFKFLSAVALIAGSSLVLQSCVEDNSYVIVNGLVPLADDGSMACDATSDDQDYESVVYDTSSVQDTDDNGNKKDTDTDNVVFGHLNVRNYISADSGWSSSSGSSSGSTFEPEPPNRGMVYIDKIVVKCRSIDGDKKACKDKESLEFPTNTPIASGGGACISFDLDKSKYKGWNSQSEIVLDISVKYHDTGILSGTSSSSAITIVTDPVRVKAWKDLQDKLKEKESSSGSGSESGDQGNEKT